MCPKKQQTVIAESINAVPVEIEWWAYKEDANGGRIRMSAYSEREVQDWIDAHPDYTEGFKPKQFKRYPDYVNDLNAIHEAKLTLSPEELGTFTCILIQMGVDRGFNFIVATAAQQSEAFLKTINKWEK